MSRTRRAKSTKSTPSTKATGARVPVKLLYFAALRERTGRGSQAAKLPARTTVAAILAQVAAHFPAAAGLIPSCRVAVNGEFADGTVQLKSGDEVAILPPVAGG